MNIISEGLISEIIAKIEKKAYIPNDWAGVSENKEVHLCDVIDILNEYRPKTERNWW